MKQALCVIIIFIFILTFCSCNRKITDINNFSQEEIDNCSYEFSDLEETDCSIEVVTAFKVCFHDVDLYNIVDYDTKGMLNALYENNSVDTYINNKFESSTTTSELMNVANEYVSLWKLEMDYAISLFTKSLNEDDISIFNDAQDSWKQHIDNNLKLHSQCLLSNGSASELAYKMPVYLASLYKKRTFEIKYLDYIVNGKSSILSLSFSE